MAMRRLHVAVLSDCIRQCPQQLLARCTEIPELAARIGNNSLVIGEEVSVDTDIILGDPARILAELQAADRAQATVSDSSSCPLSRLQWVQSTFAGVNAVVQNHSRDDYVLTRTCGFGPQMAEYCMGWALFLQQKIALAQQQQASKEWDSDLFKNRGSLHGKTLGVLGVGDIGSAVAQSARAFNMRTLGLCSSAASAASNTDENFNKVTASLMNVLIESDILVNTLPSTPHTAYMLTHDLFREASKSRGSRPGPLFINIGRGDVISTSELLACLENYSTTEVITQDHRPCLSHAVLDVVEEEPLPSSSPIWSHPQISITPHISAISTPELVLGVFTDNLIRFLEIKEEHQQDGHEELNKELRQGLKYVVDQSKGY